MSDLSNLLGDVYGHQSGSEADPARPNKPAEQAPEWASDSQLDRAFADWEPEARYPLTPAPAPAPRPADDSLSAALSAALSPAPAPAPTPAPASYRPAPSAAPAPRPAAAPAPAARRAPAPTPAPPPVAVPAPVVVAAPGVANRAWAPGDDDIFPSAGKGKNKKR